MDREFLRRHDPVSLTMAIARRLAFQLSIWHEIATWYGWSAVPGYPEKLSAFSPEDLLRVDPAIASQPPFDALGPSVKFKRAELLLRVVLVLRLRREALEHVGELRGALLVVELVDRQGLA